MHRAAHGIADGIVLPAHALRLHLRGGVTGAAGVTFDGRFPYFLTRYTIDYSDADRQALWLGLRAGGLDLVASDHVPDRLAVEKRLPAPPFPEISNGAPGIETLLAIIHGAGAARGELGIERMVDLLATTPARLFGMQAKGSIEPGKDADLVLLDATASRTMPRVAGTELAGLATRRS